VLVAREVQEMYGKGPENESKENLRRLAPLRPELVRRGKELTIGNNMLHVTGNIMRCQNVCPCSLVYMLGVDHNDVNALITAVRNTYSAIDSPDLAGGHKHGMPFSTPHKSKCLNFSLCVCDGPIHQHV
jgi:hypothetical protein